MDFLQLAFSLGVIGSGVLCLAVMVIVFVKFIMKMKESIIFIDDHKGEVDEMVFALDNKRMTMSSCSDHDSIIEGKY